MKPVKDPDYCYAFPAAVYTPGELMHYLVSDLSVVVAAAKVRPAANQTFKPIVLQQDNQSTIKL